MPPCVINHNHNHKGDDDDDDDHHHVNDDGPAKHHLRHASPFLSRHDDDDVVDNHYHAEGIVKSKPRILIDLTLVKLCLPFV